MTHHDDLRDERVDRALAGLAREVAPRRDLWPDIAARLQPSAPGGRAASRRGWAWQLAAALVLVTASSLVTAVLVRRSEPSLAEARVRPATAGGPVQAMPAAFGPGQAMSPDYETARRQLSALLRQRIDRMPVSARQKLESNLAELRRAAVEINEALDEQPGDPMLEELLLSTYQEELSVLAAASQLTAAGEPGAVPDSSRMQL